MRTSRQSLYEYLTGGRLLGSERLGGRVAGLLSNWFRQTQDVGKSQEEKRRKRRSERTSPV